jgi:hypothetical protein
MSVSTAACGRAAAPRRQVAKRQRRRERSHWHRSVLRSSPCRHLVPITSGADAGHCAQSRHCRKACTGHAVPESNFKSRVGCRRAVARRADNQARAMAAIAVGERKNGGALIVVRIVLPEWIRSRRLFGVSGAVRDDLHPPSSRSNKRFAPRREKASVGGSEPPRPGTVIPNGLL